MIGAIIGLGARLLGGKIGGSLIDKAGSVVEKVLDQKGSREAASAAVDKASIDQWTAESGKANTNWFDSLVNGFNRLMRPVAFAFTVWVVMIWPQVDLVAFQKAMVAYEAVPEWLVGLVLSVWAFLFTGRFLTKDMAKIKSKSNKEFKEILDRQKALDEMLRANMAPESPKPAVVSEVAQTQVEPLKSAAQISEKEYQKDFLDTSKPLSLPSIVLWNERHNANFK